MSNTALLVLSILPCPLWYLGEVILLSSGIDCVKSGEGGDLLLSHANEPSGNLCCRNGEARRHLPFWEVLRPKHPDIPPDGSSLPDPSSLILGLLSSLKALPSPRI